MQKLGDSTRKAARLVDNAVAPTRRVHDRLCAVVERPSPADATTIRETLAGLPNHGQGMTAAGLLDAAGLSIMQERAASMGYAGELLAAAQWPPAPPPVAAAAAGDVAGDELAFWSSHPKLQWRAAASPSFGAFLDLSFVRLLKRDDFASTVAEWASPLLTRPPTALPKDLMARARYRRDHIDGALPDPKLFDLAKLCVATLFGADDRATVDARRALLHLHFHPCQVRASEPALTLPLTLIMTLPLTILLSLTPTPAPTLTPTPTPTRTPTPTPTPTLTLTLTPTPTRSAPPS